MEQRPSTRRRYAPGCALMGIGVAVGVAATTLGVFLLTFSGMGDTTSTVIGTSPDGRYALLSVQSGFQDKVFWTELHTVPVHYERSTKPGDTTRCATGEMAGGHIDVVRPEIVVRGDTTTPLTVTWLPMRSDAE